MEGKVKWFNSRKGYGFIEGDDGTEYFVHQSALAEGKFLRENDRVSFDPAEGREGKPAASNVKLLQKGSEVEGQAEEPAPEAEEQPAEEPAEEAPEEETAEEEPKEE